MPPLFIAGVGIAVFGFIALAYRRGWQWTGLPGAVGAGSVGGERSAKTLWDWLQLLGIPLALAALAFLLNHAQSTRDQRREDERAEREVIRVLDAAREETLRTYVAKMSELILDRHLLFKPANNVAEVARVATLAAVRRLDGSRKGIVMQFLSESGMLKGGAEGGTACPGCGTFTLADADFSRADLKHAFLAARDLHGVNLIAANLSFAQLHGVNLVDAHLRGANLHGANLTRAGLGDVDFRGANLRQADLRGANVIYAGLRGAHLRGANLYRADLRKANLRQADLRGANLTQANLRGANLTQANLRGANFRQADLRGAQAVNLKYSHGTPDHMP